MKRVLFMGIAVAMLLIMSCGGGKKTGVSVPVESDFDKGFAQMLDTLLDIDSTEIYEREMQGYDFMESIGEDVSEGKKDLAAYSGEQTIRLRKLHTICKRLLKEKNYKALYDTLDNHLGDIISAPTYMSDLESVYISNMFTLADYAYPVNSSVCAESLIKLLEIRIIRLKFLESKPNPDNDAEFASIHPDHTNTTLGLMNQYNMIGNYDKSIEAGHDLLSQIAALSEGYDDEAAEVAKFLCETYRLKGDTVSARELEEVMFGEVME